MLKSIEFSNFRNLDSKYIFNQTLNIVVGKNNSGKSNLLDGIRLAFSAITDDYFKIEKSDFKNSDDSIPIIIYAELEDSSIESLSYYNEDGSLNYGFKVIVRKTQRGRYVKELSLLNGSNVDYDILKEDNAIPNICTIPLSRIDSLVTNGLATSISNFLNSDEDYELIKEKSKHEIKKQLTNKISEFQSFCEKFGQSLDIEFSDPKITDEKVYVVESNTNKEHSYRIGSGYKSIANIIINTLNEGNNIILIDEIENHLHPALIRTLIREIKTFKNIKIIGTTHSPIVLNELHIEEIMDISSISLDILPSKIKDKLNIFLHPGRGELILADNVILVEGYTEELILKNYLSKNNYNWTVINVAGVMFEPYIMLCSILKKRVIVVSDNDRSTNDGLNSSNRFINLRNLCSEKNIKLLEMDNTLETDLYNNGFLESYNFLLESHKKCREIKVAKPNKKTEIATKLIENDIDLSTWHIIKEIVNEFRNH